MRGRRLFVANQLPGVRIPEKLGCHLADAAEVAREFPKKLAPLVAVPGVLVDGVIQLGGLLVLHVVVDLRVDGEARGVVEERLDVALVDLVDVVLGKPELLLVGQLRPVADGAPKPLRLLRVVEAGDQ